MMRVVVVGAGVTGLSVARALALRGHEPIVLERAGAAPNPAASSADSHRLIRYAYGPRHSYARMVRDAYAAWERLWADLDERHHVATGQLMAGPADDPWIAGSLRSLERLGLPVAELDAGALAACFPFLDPRHLGGRAWHTPTGGVLLADRIVAGLAAWLRRRTGGAGLRLGAGVADLDPARAAARLADGSEVAGDALVVAAGAWLPRLVPGLAGTVTPSRQVVAYVRPPEPLAAAWRSAPMLIDMGSAWTDAAEGARSGGAVFYAVPPVAGTGLEFGDHRFTLGGDPDADREPRADEVRELLALAARSLGGAHAYALERARTCFYSVTPDERFLARREGRALVLSPCSGHGFKFAALIGERAATALDGKEEFASFADWLAGREE